MMPSGAAGVESAVEPVAGGFGEAGVGVEDNADEDQVDFEAGQVDHDVVAGDDASDGRGCGDEGGPSGSESVWRTFADPETGGVACGCGVAVGRCGCIHPLAPGRALSRCVRSAGTSETLPNVGF